MRNFSLAETAGMTAYRSYEDYDTSCNSYDSTRAAVGTEIVLGVLARSGRPLADQAVLDVGCGTGNYIAAIGPHVGRLWGLEYSAGMLRRAAGKLAAVPAAGLVRASAFALPFATARFDAVMFNQVVHHFDHGGTGVADFPMLRRALAEAHRVLRPSGAVVINHSSQRQIRDGFWWMALIPQAMERMAQRYIALAPLRDLLAEIGFAGCATAVPLDGILQGKDYFNPRGPLEDGWRRGDSTWTLADPAELENGLERLRAMIAANTADSWLAERDSLRQEIGQTVYVWARRPR